LRRDVERLDRQDDIAACRLFCAAVLEYLIATHPECVGEALYMFNSGEMVGRSTTRSASSCSCAAYITRRMGGLSRWSWKQACTTLHKPFISREAVDIARSYLFDPRSPRPRTLLPWLHSMESCEHTFGNSGYCQGLHLLDFVFF
ncbi:hypothetical protein FB45DRAFT_1078224, partial [Roridomyces roridus]